MDVYISLSLSLITSWDAPWKVLLGVSTRTQKVRASIKPCATPALCLRVVYKGIASESGTECEGTRSGGKHKTLRNAYVVLAVLFWGAPWKVLLGVSTRTRKVGA